MMTSTHCVHCLPAQLTIVLQAFQIRAEQCCVSILITSTTTINFNHFNLVEKLHKIYELSIATISVALIAQLIVHYVRLNLNLENAQNLYFIIIMHINQLNITTTTTTMKHERVCQPHNVESVRNGQSTRP